MYITAETGSIKGKTTELSQVTDKLSHNVVSCTPGHEQDSNSQR